MEGLSDISAEISKSMEENGERDPFYVATHSLVNYAQWKIMSPESRLWMLMRWMVYRTGMDGDERHRKRI